MTAPKRKRGKISLAPSSAKTWFNCSAAPRLCAEVPKQKGDKWGKDGTQAHQLSEECINEGTDPMDFIGVEIDEYVFGEPTGDTFIVSEDMAKACKVYVDYINSRLEGLHSSNFALESKSTLEKIGGQGGLSDTVIREPFYCLEIVDYKHGAGILVDPEDNEQLLHYLLGEFIKNPDHEYKIARITVVQPRSFDSEIQIKHWEFPYSDLKKIWLPRFKQAIEDVYNLDQTAQGDWCKYCPAKAYNCPEFNNNQLVPLTTQPLTTADMPLEKVAWIMVNEDRIKEFIKACKERVEMEMLDFRQPVDGFKIVKKKKSKKWSDESWAIEELLEKYDESTLFKKTPLTPTQMIKSIGLEEVQPYLREHVIEYTIAQEGDRRKAVDIDEI